MPKPAILSILSLFYTLFAAGQDSFPKNPSCDFTIKITDDKDKFIMNGNSISYDSCKRRLLLFPASAIELRKALKLEKRSRIIGPPMAILALPALVFGAIDKGENFKSGWVNTTTDYLYLTFMPLLVYFFVNELHYQRHLARAIQLYNAEIVHPAPAHTTNSL